MRLFVAVDLGNEDYFENIQKQINSENSKLNLTKTYHLTLKFLGEVEEDNISKTMEIGKIFGVSKKESKTLFLSIKEALNNVSFESFRVKTTKIGVFPNTNFVRVLWIGLEPEDRIIELQKKVDESLKEFFRQEKEFKPHITLARVKFVRDKEKFIENLKKIKIEEKEFEIKNIKLIKSELTPNGSVYEDLFVIQKN